MAAPGAGEGDWDVFRHKGFRFASRTGRIGSASEFESLAKALGDVTAPLPEMTYPHNAVVIEHEPTGTVLKWDAAGALQSWHAAQTATCKEMGKEVGPTAFDWTYMNDYDTTPSSLPSSQTPSPLGLPMDRLMRRDPILYFASVQLYGDELHDKGCVDTSVKLRVMDSCFLLLVRCFLRVDHDRVVVRDVRWFGDLDAAGADSGGDAGTTRATGAGLRLLKDVQVRCASVGEVVAALAREGDSMRTTAADDTGDWAGTGRAITAEEVYRVIPPGDASCCYAMTW